MIKIEEDKRGNKKEFIANASYLGSYGNAANTIVFPMAAVLAAWYLTHTKIIKLSKEDFKLKGEIVGRTLVLGICSFLSQISLVASMAAINNMIRKYGAMDTIFGQEQYAQIPMAVVGIVMKFFQIVISIVVGITAGCIPIVGYNMGAGLNVRVREIFSKLLSAEAVVGALALIIVEVFPTGLIGIFGAANESVYYTEFAVKAFRIYLCMVVFACVNKAALSFCRRWEKQWLPQCFPWLGKLCLTLALHFSCRGFMGLMEFYILCRCRMF